jgi:hypothetical protein
MSEWKSSIRRRMRVTRGGRMPAAASRAPRRNNAVAQRSGQGSARLPANNFTGERRGHHLPKTIPLRFAQEEGVPPPTFSTNKTNNSVLRPAGGQGVPHPFSKVRMGTLGTSMPGTRGKLLRRCFNSHEVVDHREIWTRCRTAAGFSSAPPPLTMPRRVAI